MDLVEGYLYNLLSVLKPTMLRIEILDDSLNTF